jgi:glutaminyl-tRNA synthetase
MRDAKLADGAAVLRAKIDMASPNINLRDPAIYRIRRATHHHTGDTWCIYPMYTFAHPIEDALEQITHSICTLEFEDQRPFYDWLLDKLAEGGLIATPHPHQYEFARLNLTYVLTSKRKLAQLVTEKHVAGWDDPRMPTIAGLRRRGYTPEALQLFAERIGVTKSDSWIDYSTLEGCLRETLDGSAARAMAVLDPVKLVLTNWDEVMGAGTLDDCSAPVHPHLPELGKRSFQIGREVWIERGDYEETPPKGFFRLFPGNKVRLKYGHVIECTGAVKDSSGQVTEVQARLVPDTKSGTPGSDSVKVKGVITWVGVADAVPAEVRLYDRLFSQAHPGTGDTDFLTQLNPGSIKTIEAFVEPSLAAGGAIAAQAGQQFQFERHGYFVADRIDHTTAKPVFNLAVGLKDSWGK